MNSTHWAPVTVVAVLSLIIILSGAKLSRSYSPITKADLTGAWALTLTGDTGCGASAGYLTLMLCGLDEIERLGIGILPGGEEILLVGLLGFWPCRG
jgi:hypothetical protein